MSTTEFVLDGQFLGFVRDGSKLKYLRMAIAQGELQIKLSKSARVTMDTLLLAGDSIQVYGRKKLDSSGHTKLKADRVLKMTAFHPAAAADLAADFLETEVEDCSDCAEAANCGEAPIVRTTGKGKKVKVLLCQKTGCRRRGGHRKRQALESILQARGLADCVTFEESGCLGKCSMAPNIVLMPGKKRLSGMSLESIADLIERAVVLRK
jgi:NADH:ubiquinone oxidoreductase subunit E